MFSTLASTGSAVLDLWKKFWRLIYKPLGFTKASAFTLFAIFGGNLLFSSLMSFKLLGDDTPAGGIFYFSTGYNVIGNKLHLIGLVFGCFIGFFQFIPIIKQKSPIADHIIGYLASLLYLISQAGLLFNITKAGGADGSAVVALCIVTFASTSSIFVAYHNAFRDKAQAFREWKIRAWGWAGTVFTLRLMIFGVSVLMKHLPNGPWYTVQHCSVIYNTYTALGLVGEKNPTSTMYPTCTGPESVALVAVKAAFDTPEGMASVYNYGFALVTWFAFVLHSAVLGLYFRTTKIVEVERPISAEISVEIGVFEKTAATITTVTEVSH